MKLHMKSARHAGMSLESFILRIQLYIPALSLTRRKLLASAMTNFFTIKWLAFCLSRTLRAIFKWDRRRWTKYLNISLILRLFSIC